MKRRRRLQRIEGGAGRRGEYCTSTRTVLVDLEWEQGMARIFMLERCRLVDEGGGGGGGGGFGSLTPPPPPPHYQGGHPPWTPLFITLLPAPALLVQARLLSCETRTTTVATIVCNRPPDDTATGTGRYGP